MEILFSAFLLSLVLVGIHAYFGLEIIRRGIIFTDLAVGQAAALGAAVSLFFWDGRFLYGCSLLAALLGAMWIALASGKGRFPEAFIGLVYALGISAVFLLLSKSPHGTEEFQRLLVSDLLYVSLDQVARTAGLYALIGLALWGLTRLPEGRLRHTGFFLLFALTVTSSVKLAGVLVVFALLVGPALVAVTLFEVVGSGSPGFTGSSSIPAVPGPVLLGSADWPDPGIFAGFLGAVIYFAGVDG